MTTLHTPDVESIIAALKLRSLDFNTYYNHVVNGTINQYYSSLLSQIASDLLAMSVEREYLGFDPLDPKEDVDEMLIALTEIASVLSTWFLKDHKVVEQDLTTAVQNTSADDIREARFLKLHKMLN